MPTSRYSFGAFTLDLEKGTLARDGTPVAVSYRALTVLSVLVQKAGGVVSKDELMSSAWPNVTVEEGNLTTQVAVLRKALGSTPDGSDFIINVPRIGYRFAAPVQQSTSAPETASDVDPGPSIAVLPFVSLGLEPQQQHFAEGLTEDIITRLSRLPWLFVSARNSSFTFQSGGIDIKHVGRELGVR